MATGEPMLTLAGVAARPELVTTAIRLADGERVVLRPLEPGDVDGLSRFLGGLSARTRRFWNLASYDHAMAAELCAAIARYDKLRLVLTRSDGEDETIIGLFEFSFDLTRGDIERFRNHGIELHPETDCRFGPCLADAYQGRGVGGQLFPAVAEVARGFGQTRMILWGGVLGDNQQGVGFYRKIGFQPVGTFQDGEGEQCIDMILTLD